MTRLTSLAALLFTLSIAPCAVADDRPMNVLFLVADDLNCDLHCYGHRAAVTPNIDALAERGVLFEHAYCQYPLCSPSRTSFLTGRRPDETQIHTNSGRNRETGEYNSSPHFRDHIPDTVTMPQRFRQADYFVARIGKLYHYGVPGQIGTNGLDDRESWDFVVNPAGRDKAEENIIFTLTPGSYGGTLSWLSSDGTDEEQTDGLVATSAISLMREHQDEPFFLAVGFYRPHTPYVAPHAYFEHYPAEDIELPTLTEADVARTPAAAYASAKREQESMTDGLRQECIGAYWASISFMDAQVGRVVDELDALGLADNTVIVMTSDHGYHMYEHGLWQKMSLFENSARVPLIISAPGANGNGRRTEALAELVDLYPTLAELCDLDWPDYLDGVSLVPVLNDPSATVRDAAFTQVRQGYSIRTAQWRYTRWNNGQAGEQLYNMVSDPSETTNLYDDPALAETVAELSERLEAYANQ